MGYKTACDLAHPFPPRSLVMEALKAVLSAPPSCPLWSSILSSLLLYPVFSPSFLLGLSLRSLLKRSSPLLYLSVFSSSLYPNGRARAAVPGPVSPVRASVSSRSVCRLLSNNVASRGSGWSGDWPPTPPLRLRLHFQPHRK